uniref:ADF-H domain-containing protein n=1 Tax=Parastrongyloides trichosuri TaxID=131310 RepID=A0A0N4ZA50_PARTI
MGKEEGTNKKSEYCDPELKTETKHNTIPIELKTSTYAFEVLQADPSSPSNGTLQLFDKDSSPDLIITNYHCAKYMTKQELVKKLERVTGELIQPMIIGRELFFMNCNEESKTALEVEPSDEPTQFEDE